MTVPVDIWTRSHEEYRIAHVLFRREISLDSSVRKARISLYACNDYHLVINGAVIGYGPAREYPEYAEYDSYDIVPYLRDGRNVIAVHVVHVGVGTFHHLSEEGRLAVWGCIATADHGEISLDTPHEWLCQRARCYESNTASFSFAQEPIQIFDGREEPRNWDRPGELGEGWETPVCLDNKTTRRASLRPRSIPHLTQEPVGAAWLLHASPHVEKERLYAHLKFVDEGHRGPHPFLCGYSFIHSPQPQRVTLASWRWEFYCNGSRLIPRTDGSSIKGRDEFVLPLRSGWNFVFVVAPARRGHWPLTFGIPESAGLVVSCQKWDSDPGSIMLSGSLGEDTARELLQPFPPRSESDCARESIQWEKTRLSEFSAEPARHLAWVRFGAPLIPKQAADREFTIACGTDASLVYDMGEMRLGRIFIELTAPRGTVIQTGFAEQLYNGRPDNCKDDRVNNAARFVAPGGRTRLETFFPYGFRYVQFGVHNHNQSVRIHRTGAISQIYPYQRAGSFECSDPFLNRLWEYGWKTLQLCSEDVLTDCPWRERTLYGGDMLPEAATTLVTSGDLRLVKRCLRVIMHSQSPQTGWLQSMAPRPRTNRPLFEYPLMVMIMSDWYCRLTGDTAFAWDCYPVFSRMIEAALRTRDERGLFQPLTPMFVDHKYWPKTGFTCTCNSVMVGAFESWASILTLLGKSGEAAEALQTAKRTEAALVAHFWDSRTNAFADTHETLEGMDPHTVAANSWALLFVGEAAKHAPMVRTHMRAVMREFDPWNEPGGASTYNAFYLLGALYKAGYEDDAERYMHQIYQRMLDIDSGTIWEHANEGKSLTHAWSTAPNYYLSTRALGVRLGFPESDNLDEILIAPQSENLSRARGTVMHPRGTVTVDWKVTGDTLELSYRVPPGISVSVAPRGRLKKLRLVCHDLGSAGV